MRRLVLALVLLAAACGQSTAAPADDGPKSALGFAAHAGAVEFPSDTDWIPTTGGLTGLVPVGGCVLGIGDYATGNRMLNVNWTGGADCAALRIGPIGGGLPAIAAVPEPDGSVSGVRTKFSHRDTGGTVTELGELRGRRDVRALARSGGNLVAVGTAFLDGQTTRPVAWVSDDGGRTERTVVLPLAPGVGGANGPNSVAAAGSELLAAGYSNPRLQLWASHDGGGSWTLSEPATPSDETLVYGILPVAGQWLLYGETTDGHTQKPFVVTGKPGAWSTVDIPGPGGVVAGTLDAHGNPVLATRTFEQVPVNARPRSCSAVLVRAGQGWQRGDLGCAESPVRVAATLTDGRVMLAGNRDLWLRPAS
ncbi:hypothetical protein M8542_01520 [Amycolatopsis sp. OK19-0408]|uniref:Exo-alpha-sialidase n=1 Tax=Amycolatopsis iheyensis TaxID=2945988 RepID=A0A9X2N613_9PSEU|nr:hypothetical protein [Amycolatopsis iheyensis]MCR6481487.1 hypothetical protein [Amycolatopsis iheyensis]